MGTGKKLLIAFHGFGNNADIFQPLAEAIGSEYTTVSIDLPGHGKTNWSTRYFKKKDLMAIVQGIKNEFGVEQLSLIGYSLGAMFLAKYLNNSPLSKPVEALILIAPTYDDDSNEDLGSFKVESATGLEKNAQTVYLFHSEDDPVSPFGELAKFQHDIPTAVTYIFKDRNHFFQPTFPELVEIIDQSSS